MKIKLIKQFSDCGCNQELAEIKANEVIDIIKEFCNEHSVDRNEVRHIRITDELIPLLELEKNITIFNEQEKF